ncbi:MAG: AMP-binding protein [Dorea sp.]|nr:AMP-binding protein [Dorea sp.]
MYQTIVEAVLAHAQEMPEKTAIGYKGTDLTYGDLANRMVSMASLLASEYGIKPQDHVLLTATSRPEYVVSYLALQYLGAVTIPSDKGAVEESILDTYRYHDACFMMTDLLLKDESIKKIPIKSFYQRCIDLAGDSFDQLTERFEIPAYRVPEKKLVSEILFTTGTTGRPKGTMLSYENIYASMHNTWKGTGMLSSDIILMPLTLNHSLGMRITRTALYIGATIVLENGFVFTKQLCKAIEDYGCTGFGCVPASLERLYRQMGDEFAKNFGKLRYMEVGAGSLSLDMKKRLSKILPNTTIANTWGSTETGGAIFLNRKRDTEKYDSLGKPVEGVEFKIVDPDGKEKEAHDFDSAGRMALRGSMQMMGYYKLEEPTKAAIVEGWLFTNDLVYTDADGYVYMLGRADDIINVGGEKVSPVEVENLASEHPMLQECACVGVEDPEGILGQVPVLYYVVEAGENPSDSDITNFLAARMEGFKIPKYFVRIEELPRNRMKKLDRKAMKKLWAETGQQSISNPVMDAILTRQSIREFSEEVIPKPILEELLKCAIQAPSANNMQTWRFVVLQDQGKIARLKETIQDVIANREGKKIKFYGFNNPNVVVLITNDRRNENGAIDCALAAENLMLAAHSLGIGSVWNNALKNICGEEKIRTLLGDFGINKKHDVCATILLGYPAGGDVKKIARRSDVVTWL